MKIILMLTGIATVMTGGLSTHINKPEETTQVVIVPISSQIEGNPEARTSMDEEVESQNESEMVEEPIKDGYDASEREIECLASAIHYEARGEIKEGQIAVAEVVIARAESDLYPDDLCKVIAQKSQFSFVRNGVIPNVPEAARSKRVEMAKKVVSGDLTSRIRGAMYFHAGYVSPSWRHRLNRVARIGEHIFYRR